MEKHVYVLEKSRKKFLLEMGRSVKLLRLTKELAFEMVAAFKTMHRKSRTRRRQAFRRMMRGLAEAKRNINENNSTLESFLLSVGYTDEEDDEEELSDIEIDEAEETGEDDSEDDDESNDESSSDDESSNRISPASSQNGKK